MSDRYPTYEHKLTEKAAKAAEAATDAVATKQANKIVKNRRTVIIEAEEARIKADIIAKQHARRPHKVPKRLVEEAEQDAREKEESRDALVKAETAAAAAHGGAAAAAGHNGGYRRTRRHRRSLRRKSRRRF